MFKITLIEYVRPNARRISRELQMPENMKAKYEEIVNAGCFLTVEDLRTGLWQICVDSGQADICSLLTANPRCLASWTELLDRFSMERMEEIHASLK